MELKAIKLSTGEELITGLTKVGDNYQLDTPVLIVLRQENPAFIPWMPYAESITIHASNVIVISDPIVEVRNAYNQYFGSGIQVVKAGSILNG